MYDVGSCREIKSTQTPWPLASKKDFLFPYWVLLSLLRKHSSGIMFEVQDWCERETYVIRSLFTFLLIKQTNSWVILRSTPLLSCLSTTLTEKLVYNQRLYVLAVTTGFDETGGLREMSTQYWKETQNPATVPKNPISLFKTMQLSQKTQKTQYFRNYPTPPRHRFRWFAKYWVF